jgi:hypothetical protein
MNFTIQNAQNDGGGLAPHIIRIWDVNSNLMYEHVCKGESSFSAPFVKTLPDDIYDIEVVNPNLFDSKVVRSFKYWDSSQGGFVQFGSSVDVFSGQSETIRIDASQISSINLETLNFGFGTTPILRIVGDSSISGIDLDGNTLQPNETIFSELNFENIATGVPTNVVLKNKKYWNTADGVVDVSSYIPYLPKTQAVIQMSIPIIEVINQNTINWKNVPPILEEIGYYLENDSGVLLANTFIPNSINKEIEITGLGTGNYKIKWFVLSNSTQESGYSNILNITQSNQPMENPVISKIDETSIRWDTPTFASFVTRTVTIFKDNQFYRTDIFSQSGTINIGSLPNGTYKIKYETNTNSGVVSDFSNEIQLLPEQSANPVITRLPEQSANPVITGFENTIKSDGFAIVNIAGIVGSVIHFQNSLGFDFVVGTITNSNGTIVHGIQNAGSYTYTQIESGKSVSQKTNPITINPNPQMVSCANGTFDITSASYSVTNQAITFQFNASGLSSGTFVVKDSSGISVNNGTFNPTSNIVNISVSGLTNGTYTLQIDGTSCIGTATKTFVVSGVIGTSITPPVINPNGLTQNNGGTYNVTDLQSVVFSYTGNKPVGGTIQWYEKNNTTGNLSPRGSTETFTVSATTGYSYVAKFVDSNGVSSSESNNVAFNIVVIGGSSCGGSNNSFAVNSVNYNPTAGTITFQFHAVDLISGTWKILQDTTVKQSGTVLPTSNTPVLSGINSLPNGTYSFELNGVSCTGTATKSFTVSGQTTMPSCNNGTFDINSIMHNPTLNTISYVFNASNLITATWRILNSNGVSVDNGNVTHTSNNPTVNVQTITTSGTYTFELTGTSCTGVATKTFVVSGGGTGTTKTMFASAKFPQTTQCSSAIVQFGYSSSAGLIPTIWNDSNGTKRLLNTNGVITEVTTGGDIYQTRQFDLTAGTYHFFARQKDVTSNTQYLGQITV